MAYVRTQMEVFPSDEKYIKTLELEWFGEGDYYA